MSELHARDWIATDGKFLRTINLSSLRRKLGREKGQCTWCGKQVPKRRKRWCSTECSKEGYRRCGYDSWRGILKRRDRGICAKCGSDELKSKEWEADHIVPVCEGGGLCDADGMQTLCIPCHKIETKLLAGRRAERRKNGLE